MNNRNEHTTNNNEGKVIYFFLVVCLELINKENALKVKLESKITCKFILYKIVKNLHDLKIRIKKY
jgi:hypothetical protein